MLDEPVITDGVTSVVGVLPTVDLDDQPLLSTDEIYDIRPERLLTHEFESAERPGTKISPKLSLSGC